MIDASEYRALLALEKEMTVSDLAAALDRSVEYASELVAELDEHGLVKTHKEGRARYVTPADAECVQILRDLDTRFDHVPWAELLSGQASAVVYYLDGFRSVAEIAAWSRASRSTVYRVLDRLQDRGLITKQDAEYRLADDFELVHDFATSLVTHHHRQTAAEIANQWSLLWTIPSAFLLGTDTRVDDARFIRTGPARFEEYGLELVGSGKEYYYFDEGRADIDASDLVCHTLLIDDGARYRGYCLLLMAQTEIDPETVRDQAQRYGVTDVAADLIAFLETEGKERSERMPTWDDLIEMADQYGVEL